MEKNGGVMLQVYDRYLACLLVYRKMFFFSNSYFFFAYFAEFLRKKTASQRSVPLGQ